LDVYQLELRFICDTVRIEKGKEMLARIVSMLTKLIQRYSIEQNFRETASEYAVKIDSAALQNKSDDENEDEDEDDSKTSS